jgi:gluconokinase
MLALTCDWNDAMVETKGTHEQAIRWVVMGVSGCGKSTVGKALAAALGARFVEGDAYHPAANVAKMSAGLALDDADRAAWLLDLQTPLREARARGEGIVLSCSALKRRYRDVLRAADPTLRFAHLDGARTLLAERLGARVGHYMPPSLLASQLGDLGRGRHRARHRADARTAGRARAGGQWRDGGEPASTSLAALAAQPPVSGRREDSDDTNGGDKR